MSDYKISSQTLSLTLNSKGKVISLRDSRSNQEFLSAQSEPVGLWQMGLIRPVSYNDPLPPVTIPKIGYEWHEWFANREEYQADLELDSNDCDDPLIEWGDSMLKLTWTVTIPDGVAILKMSIRNHHDERLEFYFDVKIPKTWAIKRATYPRIRGFGNLKEPDEDFLLYPETWGVLRRNPLEDETNYSGQYPAHINWCQMLAWLHQDKGVYLGIQDPDTNHIGLDMQYVDGKEIVPLESDTRTLHLTEDGERPAVVIEEKVKSPLFQRLLNGSQPSMQLRCHHWPAMTDEWSSPYPVVLQGFSGCWYDAALIHKDWATQQRWCRRGKLIDRKDTSSKLAGLDLWFNKYGFDPRSFEPEPAWGFQKAMHDLHDFFEVPFGVHWYNWHDFSWHSRFPSHTPAVEGFKEVLKDLQERDIVVMPYCQGRLLYRDREGLEQERAHASVESNGQPYLEKYTDEDDWPLALCPSAVWSQEQWNEAARLLWEDYGVEGVYFDQITAMPPSLCYHAGHGHPLGGGNHYWKGYDKALDRIKPMIDEDPNRFLSSELMADAFIDRIDLYLSFVPPLEDFVPLHPAIYSGYTTVMGRNTPDNILDDPQLFSICQGELLLFGGQLGWINDSILNFPKAANYLKDLAMLRSSIRDFLHYGTFQRPLCIEQEDRIELVFPSSVTGKGPVHINRPAVRHSIWKMPDQRRLMLFLNEATVETTIKLNIPNKWPKEHWTLRTLGEEHSKLFFVQEMTSLTLQPLSILALSSPGEDER